MKIMNSLRVFCPLTVLLLTLMKIHCTWTTRLFYCIRKDFPQVTVKLYAHARSQDASDLVLHNIPKHVSKDCFLFRGAPDIVLKWSRILLYAMPLIDWAPWNQWWKFQSLLLGFSATIGHVTQVQTARRPPWTFSGWCFFNAFGHFNNFNLINANKYIFTVLSWLSLSHFMLTLNQASALGLMKIWVLLHLILFLPPKRSRSSVDFFAKSGKKVSHGLGKKFISQYSRTQSIHSEQTVNNT